MKVNYEFRSMAHTSFDAIYECYLNAFKGYPFQWTQEALYKTIQRRGYEPSLSFGAFYDKKLVSFTLNGIGLFHGKQTAYDTGTGTMEEHRGQGLASGIFEYSLPYLKSSGIKQYLLEVLEENKTAFSIYKKQGFEVSRTFDCFRVNSKEWFLHAKEVERISLNEIDFSLQPKMESMFEGILSWQNSFESLRRNARDFKVIGAFHKNDLVGYGIIDVESGDIPQLAVGEAFRRRGIGTMILYRLKQLNQSEICKVINIEKEETNTIAFILACGIPKIVSQYEMIKHL